MFADVDTKKLLDFRDEKKALWGDEYGAKVEALRWTLSQFFRQGSGTLDQIADSMAAHLVRQFTEKGAEDQIEMMMEVLSCALADVTEEEALK